MIVIIQDKSYLEKSFANVDGDEYRETMMNIKKYLTLEQYITQKTLEIESVLLSKN